MKNLFIIAVLLLMAMVVGPVYANEKEAGEAAKLASGAATVSEKKQDNRIVVLREFLESVHSPLAPHAETFILEADKNQLDWRLVPAIAGLESGYGKFIPHESFNAWGWAVFNGKNYGAKFEDWDDGIATVSHGLKTNYIDDGLLTVDQIGARYASSPTWSYRVKNLMDKFYDSNSTYKPIQLLAITL